jgi:hypothetical protein
MANQFEFAFIDDGKGLRLFQRGAEVCRGQQQALQRDEVYWSSKTSSIGEQIDQKDGGGRKGPGRGCWGGGTPCGEPKVPGVQK